MPTIGENAGSQLGQLLFGRPDQDKEFLQGQAMGSLVQDHMAQASRARAAAMIDQDRLGARQGITPDSMTTAGFAANQAPLLEAILRSAETPSLTNLGELQAPTSGQALADANAAMRGGNVQLGNQLLAVANHAPLESTRVTEGQVFDPYGSPTQPIALTQLGTASANEKAAAATDHNAAAGEHQAQADRARAGIGADKAGNYDIVQTDHGLVRANKLNPADVQPLKLGDATINQTGTGKSAASDPNSDASVLAQARQRIQSGADPKTVAAYLAGKGYPGVANKLLGNGAADGQ